jgi:type II secretory pathway component GspD/PulD (secretin)
MITKTYAVADLVIPVNNFSTLKIAGKPAAEMRKQEKTLEDKLIKLIQSTVQPKSWSDQGGKGAIQYFPLGMALVVFQTANIQEEIADLLCSLRRLQDVEVAVETRIYSLPPSLLKNICGEFQKVRGERFGLKFLSDAELKKLAETVQADQRGGIMQAPKMTMFNGQTAMVNVTDFEKLATEMEIRQVGEKIVAETVRENFATGLKLGLQPVVSADRRYVNLTVNANVSELNKPSEVLHAFQRPTVTTMGVKVTACIPDGRTMVVCGWDSRHKDQTMCHVLLVTPRIVINEEEEVRDEPVGSPEVPVPDRRR